MGTVPEPADYPQKRRYRRFPLKYPVRVEFHSGELACECDAVSRNVSVGGLLLETESLIPQRSPVSFTMVLQGGRLVRTVELTGEGEVVRVETGGSEARFVIAVACKHPIAHMEDHLAAAG